MQEFVDIAGIIVPHDSLTIDRAVALANLAASNRLPYVRLVECRRQNSEADVSPIDTVVLDLTVERPQSPVNDIRHTERIAIVFNEADRYPPEVQAVRASFPWVPHLNLRHEEFPRSLCLYDRSWSEMSPRWTPADFLERIRYWLAATARGELHQEDQPLEPLLLHNGLRIILPQSIYADLTTEVPAKLDVYLASDAPSCRTLIATNTEKETSQQYGLKFVATVFRGEPRAHGLIRRSPRNLKELDTFLSQSGIQFIDLLRDRLLAFDAVLRDERLILVMVLPVVRSSGREIESWNVWAFATEGTIKQVGAAIGIWDIHNGDVAQILFGPDVSRNGENARIDVLSPYSDFSPTTAALANGIVPDCLNVLAVGAGALGSQIINTMARTGFGQWTIVDEDELLPHNLARHALHGGYIGISKAVGMAHFLNAIYENAAKGIVADVLRPEDKTEVLNNAYDKATIILDISASAVVSRHLSLDVKCNARRVSVFLNPQGTDIVVLAEDEARTLTLDLLEAAYYQVAATDSRMRGHLGDLHGRLRYGRSCRDISTTMSTSVVTMLSALATQLIRRVLDNSSAAIHVLRCDPQTLAISNVQINPGGWTKGSFGEWTLFLAGQLLAKLSELRATKLPNETGGVLIGLYDLDRKFIYVVDTVPSPPDSAEWPTLYIRGAEGLLLEVEIFSKRTSGQLEYIGEWHSHPDNCPTLPSPDDIKVFAWLTEHMSVAGLPALMAIVGESNASSWFLGKMKESGGWSL